MQQLAQLAFVASPELPFNNHLTLQHILQPPSLPQPHLKMDAQGTYPEPVYPSTGTSSATSTSTTNNTTQTASAKAQNAAQQTKAKAANVGQGILNHPVVQSATDTVNAQVNALDKELGKHQFARDVEAKTKVPKAYTFLGLVGTLFITIFFNTFNLAPAVTNVIGYLLPAYFSVQALESSGTVDDKQWLTYWIVFSSFTLLESVFLRFILYWVPYWFVLKTVAIVYLQLPGTRGAAVLYDNVIRPVLARSKQSPSQARYSSATSSVPVTSDHDRVL